MSASGDEWRKADPRLQMAVDHALTTLAEQREHLGEIRNRTIGFLTIATVAVGFVRDSVFPSSGHIPTLGALALGALGLLFACTVAVSFPLKLVFMIDPATYRWQFANRSTMDEVLRTIFDQAALRAQANQCRLKWAEIVYVTAALALGCVLALLAAVTATR